ncbi:MAG: hypothetical protein FK734_08290, partial [Asgard group archaeon]|nr:hypothetical protein [Asgard group archaeon]
MKRPLLLIIIISSLMISQTMLMQPNQINVANGITTTNGINTNILTNFESKSPATTGGFENIQSNFLEDPSFEEDDGEGGPSEFSAWGTANVEINSAYQDETYVGAYGSYNSVEGTEQVSMFATNEYSLYYLPVRSYMNQLINFNFAYNCKQNPDIASNARFYISLQIMSDIGNIYLLYYLSSSSFPGSNSTYYAYYDLRGAAFDTWTSVSRNLTKDFIEGFPARNYQISYVRAITFYLNSPSKPTGPIISLIDEVSLLNGSSFNFMADNGDFEDGDGFRWTNYETDPGYVYLSDSDSTLDTHSLNITAESDSVGSYSEGTADLALYDSWNTMPKGLFASQSGDVSIGFDWKYSRTGLGEFYSYISLAFYNATYSATIFLILTHSSTLQTTFSNSSGPSYMNLYIKADQFNVFDTWNHFEIDQFELLELSEVSNLPLYYLSYGNHASGTNTRAVLLIDAFELLSYPTNDPSFEGCFDYSPTDPIITWTATTDHNFVNLTSDAHLGNYAANLSAYIGNANVYCRRNMHMPIENNQFTDFWWRLDKITNLASSTFGTIKLRLDGGVKTIIYLLAENDDAVFANSSSSCVYTVDGYNEIGVWHNLYRNLTNDVYSAFGENNWNLTQVELYLTALGSNEVSIIFDDIQFVRDNTGPTIENPDVNPSD